MAVKKPNKRARVVPKHKRPREIRKFKIQQKDEPVTQTKNRKTLVVAQEIKFAKLLAGNDKKVRDKVLKNLKKWLVVRSKSSFAFTEEDFMRLWKGLFYCMWMSDKPLIQEELAESLSKIVHCFDYMETALLYTKCALKTLSIEWFGIDQYRVDKFEMLVRRIIRQTFEMCKKRTWSRDWVKGVEQILESLLIDAKTPLGFTLHLTELYMEELSKVSCGHILPEVVTELVRPFAVQLAVINDERQISHVVRHIFQYLLFQSDVGMEYLAKFQAWKEAGFPGGDIDSMQKLEISAEEVNEDTNSDVENDKNDEDQAEVIKPLDPRAGRVDVELPQIPFDARAIANTIVQYRFHPSSTTKTRKQILRLTRQFNELADGKMPLGLKKVKLPQSPKAEIDPNLAATRLIQFERDLYSDTIKGKRKKKRNVEFSEKNMEENNTDSHDDNIELSSETESDDNFDIITEDIPKKKQKVESTKQKSRKSIGQNGEEFDVLKTEDVKQKNHKRLSKKERQMNKQGIYTKKNNVLHVEQRYIDKESKAKKNNCDIMQTDGGFSIEIEDGMDDFGNFVNSLTPVKAKKTKKENSPSNWIIVETDDPPTPTAQLRSNITEVNKNYMSATESSTILPSTSNTEVKELLEPSPKLHKLSPQKVIELNWKPENGVSSPKKRVKIVLQRNTAQHTSEYMKQLQQSPAIPYDANRKPPAGVLKPSPLPSPVNPFYKRKNC
ncbi:ribosomal RNA processing protein 1 homolog [Cephus cinctus]|uniref:Ribosomal RNA processing protein 1 homolog n=1 Tax=Cephus cinctus TaxID=211228 RepID=A0AAJ7BIC8_CEPCN|nr:ribosomal RNA processing protein 1 homolog [Cephus cinctus]